MEFRKIDKLGSHHHSISMSEWDENDQFPVCWAGRNHSGMDRTSNYLHTGCLMSVHKQRQWTQVTNKSESNLDTHTHSNNVLCVNSIESHNCSIHVVIFIRFCKTKHGTQLSTWKLCKVLSVLWQCWQERHLACKNISIPIIPIIPKQRFWKTQSNLV